ncbi:MAG: hypothetical protein ACRC2H_04735, partial [Silanimonas sp.]
MSIAAFSNGTRGLRAPALGLGVLAKSTVAGLIVMACAWPAAACDLDGLSHGYGPMSALFAGAHQYKSLNGLDEAADDPATDTAT